MIVMRAISLWQPWASLWLTESKVHETRHWPTKHRGWLIVHAAKKLVKLADGDPLDEICWKEFGGHRELPAGAIIGAIDLTACTLMRLTAPDHQDDMECGNWSDERYAWRRGDHVRLPVPIPYKGRQGLFDVPADDIGPLLDLIHPDDQSGAVNQVPQPEEPEQGKSA